jgi:hypothetical protein
MIATGMAPQQNPQQLNVGGIMAVKSVDTLRAEDVTAAAMARAQEAAGAPVVQSLVALVRRHWSVAKEAKLLIEKDMLSAVRSRRGEYDAEKLSRIREQGGSEIYMMLFATKARQLKALLGEVFIGTGAERCWTLTPTPKPDISPEKADEIMQAVQQQVMELEQMGQSVPINDIRQALRDAKDAATNEMNEAARDYAERAGMAIEDVLVEGGWLEALDEFLDDLATFKTAFIKGPVVRNSPRLTWQQGPDGRMAPQVTIEPRAEWERVDPFMMYPMPLSKSVHHGYLIERHKLSRGSIAALIGLEGYSEDAIRGVLDAHGTGGLHEWLQIDTEKPDAEGRHHMVLSGKAGEDIDALQYWGSVSGKMLLEWGMAPEEVPDESHEYEVEVWLIGSWVIKAVINPDPLLRRPYFADGFSRVPGAFWHNSLFDVVRDCQDMCNAAARALSNNMGISSGPQVVVNVDRLAQGEDLTELHPWKIHQVTTDPMGSSAKPIDFFQPGSNANELMGIFERFSTLADDFSGVPRYTVGLGGGEGGASRTASGLSMQLGNASKQIKSQASSIDIHVVAPAIERQYQFEMLYNTDTEIKGDLQIQARGALSLMTKEQAQVRRNEFLMATTNPVDLSIIGVDGRAELLRESVKGLNMNPDKIIPSVTAVKMKAAAQAAQAAQAQQSMGAGQPGQPSGSGQELMNGAPTTDLFSPQPQ